MSEGDQFGPIYESRTNGAQKNPGRLHQFGRLVRREFTRLLSVALLFVGLGAGVYGLAQAKDAADRWGWVEANGTVVEQRSEFLGLWYQWSVVVEAAGTFAELPKEGSVEIGDRIDFFVDPRDAGTYDQGLGLPLREGSLTSWQAHAVRAGVGLLIALVGVVGARRLWRSTDPIG